MPLLNPSELLASVGASFSVDADFPSVSTGLCLLFAGEDLIAGRIQVIGQIGAKGEIHCLTKPAPSVPHVFLSSGDIDALTKWIKQQASVWLDQQLQVSPH